MAIFRKNDVGKASLFSKKTICFYNFIYDYISVDDVLMTPRVVIFFFYGDYWGEWKIICDISLNYINVSENWGHTRELVIFGG